MIKNKAMAVVFANMHDNAISNMTLHRSMASVPFCGRYRIIDFYLSSLVLAGITQVSVVAKANYHSLMDHLGAGRDWDLSRKIEGLSIYPPFSLSDSAANSHGRIATLFNVLEHIRYSTAEYVVMLDCDHICNIDMSALVNDHIDSGAEVTILSTDHMVCGEDNKNCIALDCNEDGRVVDMMLDLPFQEGRTTSMNVFVLSKALLVKLIEEAHSRMLFSFEHDILLPELRRGMFIRAERYEGFVSRITSTKSYFYTTMSLLQQQHMQQLFCRPVYTKVHDDAPTRYGLSSHVVNSLLADGCVVDGDVENSVLFRGVKVEKGTVIKNSIVMQGSTVRAGCELNYVITDKNVTINENRRLIGYESYPIYIEKRSVV